MGAPMLVMRVRMPSGIVPIRAVTNPHASSLPATSSNGSAALRRVPSPEMAATGPLASRSVTKDFITEPMPPKAWRSTTPMRPTSAPSMTNS